MTVTNVSLSSYTNPYTTNKLAHHGERIACLRQGNNDTLIQVHFMPCNICNQRCSFCSYRMPSNKNSQTFNEKNVLPIADIRKLVDDMKELKVQAVEVTGGGEPLAHPDKHEMFDLLINAGFDVALVTNGTLLDDALAERIAPNLTWMRVSIDASTPGTYAMLRNAPEWHFDAAVDAIRKIRAVGNHKEEFRLGAGYVMANGNELDVYDICKIVKEAGADNIRLSMTFSDQFKDFFTDPDRVQEGIALAEKAVLELSDESFQVINLIPERWNNILSHSNEYHACYTKDVLCVVEGEGNVYTCCTFTGSSKGKLGNILSHDKGFKGVWNDSFEFRKNLDPRKYCNVTCLYAKRNLQMIDIIENNASVDPASAKPIHVNFI